MHLERLYIKYAKSEALNFRIGKQTAPIGYWNKEPINVLRETTSKPFFTTIFFPKFLTGINIFGNISLFDDTYYHLFIQKTKDLDEDYTNIPNKYFIGLSFEKDITLEWHINTAFAEYKENNKDDKNRLIQISSSINTRLIDILFENVYNIYKNENSSTSYLQFVYHNSLQYNTVIRYENINHSQVDNNNLIIIGVNYRPILPISLKAEYQIKDNDDDNQILFSLSMLF